MSGVTVLQYEFLEKIGAGGMGEVFKAHDKRLNRFVAIKVLAPGKSGDPERRRRFIQEAQSASALSHPNIITIHDIFHEGETHYIVMEYVGGRTLLDLIPGGGLRIAQVLQYATQMADALSVAHTAGIVHRDFKPANVMVSNSGLVKILDFGLAKLIDQPHWLQAAAAAASTVSGGGAHFDDAATLNMPLTMEGSILGTVNYMSPEQAEGKRVDGRSDVFSFGAVLYEMVTGRRAFQGDSDISTLSAVLRDEARPISELVVDVPHEIDDLIRICLRKDPDSRWQSMKEIEMGLTAMKRRSDAGVLYSRPASPPDSTARNGVPLPTVAAAKTRSKKAYILGAVGVAVAILLALTMAWWWTSHRHAPAVPVAQVTAPTPGSKLETTPQVPAAAPPPDAAVTETKPANAIPAQINREPLPAAPIAPVYPSVVPPPSVAQTPKSEPQLSAAAQVVSISVGDGSPLKIALAEDVPMNAPEGQEVTFRVLEDLKADDVIVIARGATVTGSIVTDGAKKKFLGIGGKMTFKLISAEAVNGQKLTVRAAAGRRTDGETSRPIDTGKYAKAKDLAAARGTDYIAYIDGDQTLSVHK